MKFMLSLLFICLSLPVQASTFKINFFDSNQAKVGSGTFDIDFGRTICVDENSSGNCVDKQNPLVSFSASVQGQSWHHNSEPEPNVVRWWSAPGQEPGSGPQGRTGGITEGQWFFGDSVGGEEQFLFTITQATSNTGRGEWTESLVNGPNGTPLFGQGTWSTNVVPIPAAIWLFFSGLSSLFVIRKKHKAMSL